MNRDLSNRLSIKNLANQNQIDEKNSNLDILKKNREENVDTYIIELESFTAGIANLTSNNMINVYIGSKDSKNISININEFNSKYIIMDDYNFTEPSNTWWLWHQILDGSVFFIDSKKKIILKYLLLYN